MKWATARRAPQPAADPSTLSAEQLKAELALIGTL
jgi:hypothetical protein